jgi:hypothetical protein
MPAITPPDKMIATAISIEILNLINTQLFDAHKFDYVLDYSNTQGGDTFFKTTDCDINETCIGTLFPEIAANYSGWKIVIDVKALEPRKAFMSATEFYITGKFAGKIKAINETSDETVSLYNFIYTLKRYSSFIIVGLNIQHKPLNVEFSTLEFVPAYEDVTSANILLAFVIENLRIKFKALVNGLITLPKMVGMSWIDPQLTQIDGAIVFSANVAFTPF